MSGVVLKVYNLFYRMAKKTPDGSVSFSNPVIARMINGGDRGGQRSGNYLSRVKTALVRAGLFEPLGVRKNKQTGIWMGGRYIPVPHNEWAKNQTKTLGHSPCFPRPVIVRVEKNNSPSTSKTTSSKQKDAVAPCAPWDTHAVRTLDRTSVRTPECAQAVDSLQGASRPSIRQASRSSHSDLLFKCEGRGFPPSKPSPQEKQSDQEPSFGDRLRSHSWKLLQIEPSSVSKEFRRLWEGHVLGSEGSPILDVIDYALENAQRWQIPVPRKFFVAKIRFQSLAAERKKRGRRQPSERERIPSAV